MSFDPSNLIPGVGVFNFFKGIFAPPSKERNFKDGLEQLLKSMGVPKETIERLRDVLDTGRDQDIGGKIAALMNGTLTGKDGQPITLPAPLPKEAVTQLAAQVGMPTSSLDPNLLPDDPPAEEPADGPSPALTQTWVRA